MGTISSTSGAECSGWQSWLDIGCWGSNPINTVAPPPAPTGAALTTPPASGQDAAALVQSLANQQATGQQAIDASQVQPSLWSQITGTAYDVGSTTIPAVFDWSKYVLWGAAGALLLFGMAASGGGRPRRYGR